MKTFYQILIFYFSNSHKQEEEKLYNKHDDQLLNMSGPLLRVYGPSD